MKNLGNWVDFRVVTGNPAYCNSYQFNLLYASFKFDDNCNGCGICERNCFVNAIKLRGKIKKIPFWEYNCESCLRCAAICPKNAIEAGHSWGVILYIISTIPVSTSLFSYLGNFIQWIEFSKSHWFGDIINLVYFYTAIFFSYYIFHGAHLNY
ncbi:MAG: 4Fe-4S binding protein [Spirochaetota bacterium]|nr:4Fe-4S binding protein [Spirochaetota bacterium]